MTELTSKQKEKLDKVSEITKTNQKHTLITDARAALAFAMKHGLVKGWSDYGNHYTFAFVNSKQIQVKPFEVGELIVDKFIELNYQSKTAESNQAATVQATPKRKPKVKEDKE